MVIIDGLYILRFLWGMWWESEGDGDIGIRMANRGGVCGGTEEGGDWVGCAAHLTDNQSLRGITQIILSAHLYNPKKSSTFAFDFGSSPVAKPNIYIAE